MIQLVSHGNTALVESDPQVLSLNMLDELLEVTLGSK